MNTLGDFGARIEALLAEAEREHAPAYPANYMAQFEDRMARVDQQARHLLQDVIRPRLEKLATYYPNASLDRHKDQRHAGLWLGYTEGFPANARAEFSLLPDEQAESLVILYQSHIVPAYIKYDRFDRLSVPLESAADEAVANWVEGCLLRFVRACLAIRQGSTGDEEPLVTDPVCGMQVRKSLTTSHSEYLGHPYFFCSERCRDKFGADPLRYVVVTTDY
jgi:YHS domain-containing protein